MTEIYSLSVNFPNGLLDSQLRDEVNTTIITKTCEGVSTVGDEVKLFFNANLDAGEKNQLDTLISNYVVVQPPSVVTSDFFAMGNPLLLFETYQLNNFTVVKLQDNYPTGFTKIGGLMNYFNPVSGVFLNSGNPSIFLYNISLFSTSANNNTDVKIRVCDENNNAVFGSDNRLNANGDVWAFMGNGGILTNTTPVKYSLSVDTNDFVCDLTVKFLQILC